MIAQVFSTHRLYQLLLDEVVREEQVRGYLVLAESNCDC
jgi:hypothetical protein